jgi:transcriptional regulator with XRE-family HTH domain
MTTRLRARSAQELGDVVRQARVDLGMTQTALARAAKVGRQWLNAFEAGDKSSAPIDMLLRIAHALDAELVLTPDNRSAPSTPKLDTLPDRARRATRDPATTLTPMGKSDRTTASLRPAASRALDATDMSTVLKGATIDTSNVLAALNKVDTASVLKGATIDNADAPKAINARVEKPSSAQEDSK